MDTSVQPVNFASYSADPKSDRVQRWVSIIAGPKFEFVDTKQLPPIPFGAFRHVANFLAARTEETTTSTALLASLQKLDLPAFRICSTI